MKLYKPSECYLAVSFILHLVTIYQELKPHIIGVQIQPHVSQEAEAASEAPAEDDFSAEANDWGSEDDEDEWGDDDDDWKRKKRSVVEQESPSERWTRETHEVRFGVESAA